MFNKIKKLRNTKIKKMRNNRIKKLRKSNGLNHNKCFV